MTTSLPPAESWNESLLARATEDYLERLDRGEQPDVEEYQQRFPDIAVQLAQVLPMARLFHRRPSPEVSGDRGVHTPSVASLPRTPDLPPPLPHSAPPGYELHRELGRGGPEGHVERKSIPGAPPAP